MIHGVYGAAVAMEGAARQHEVISQNLAHAQVPGFRRAQLIQGTFDDSVKESFDQLAERSSTQTRGIDTAFDFTTGLIEQTDRPFDVAIQGKGFFVVGDQGSPLYTRNGAFTTDATGQLVTQDGRPVQGIAGPIRVGQEVAISELTIDPMGRVLANNIEVGRLKIMEIPDSSLLENVGTTLFSDPSRTMADVENVEVRQGYLERSNVHPVQELVDMIAVQRRYDAASRTLRTLMKTIEQRINLQGGN